MFSIFYFQKFVDNAQQCFAFTPQANFPLIIWIFIEGYLLRSFYFTYSIGHHICGHTSWFFFKKVVLMSNNEKKTALCSKLCTLIDQLMTLSVTRGINSKPPPPCSIQNLPGKLGQENAIYWKSLRLCQDYEQMLKV